MGGTGGELRPSKAGSLFLTYDLTRSRSEARALVLQQSVYWAGSVIVLALVLWLAFHFLLTRRTARLVRAAEQFASGDLSARSDLSGDDELGKLSQVFDAMATEVARTQRQLGRNITGRERSERALRISQASYSASFDSAQDAIFVHDLETGAIVDANPSATALFGYTLAEFKRIDIAALSSGEPPYTQQDAMAMLARASAGEQLRIEWHSRNKDGRQRWDELSVKRVTIRGQDRILAMARDITEKKRVAEEVSKQREALYQREKLAALGSLLAGVAHELNNPLSVVVARAVMLEEQGGSGTQDAAVKIRSAAERCARIVRTFLAMARQQQPQRGMIAIDDVVAAALDIASYAMRTSGIEVRLDLCREIPRILADGDQVHQVVLNLIINAQQSLQERPAPRRIGIASRSDPAGGMVRLMVSDNGPGVPPSLRARVFEPYFTTKSIGVGTGVGLAVSLGIVEAHGGTITLDCPGPGRGDVYRPASGGRYRRGNRARGVRFARTGRTRVLGASRRRRIGHSRHARGHPAQPESFDRHGSLRAGGPRVHGGCLVRCDSHRHPDAGSGRSFVAPGDRTSLAGSDRAHRVRDRRHAEFKPGGVCLQQRAARDREAVSSRRGAPYRR